MSSSSGSENNHPTPLTYFKIAIILVTITAVEVGIIYMSALEFIMIPLLLLLSAVKFGLVILFYMHLKFDHRLFSGLFLGGLVVALFAFVAVLTLFQVFSSPNSPDVATVETTHQTSPSESEPVKESIAEEKNSVAVSTDNQGGGNLIVTKGCAACHSVSGITGAMGVLGPNLDGIGNRAATRQSGQTAEEYIRASIETPTAFVVEDFDPIMPELRSTLTDSEFEQIVAFLLTLK